MSDDKPPSPRAGAKAGAGERNWWERLAQALGGEPKDKDDWLEMLRQAQQRNLFDPYVLAMIEGVFAVSEEQVRDVMVPRAQMVVVEQEDSFDKILATVVESGHSRFPVIGEGRDEVVGILLAKDLLQFARDPARFDLRELLRPAVFIPESKRLITLLREFRSTRNHMAVVVDEYGGVSGLVTIEDVIELIVGDIDDEHDTESGAHIRPQGDGHYIVDAVTEIEAFNEYFGVELDDSEYDTIGGLILGQLGRLPKRGEELELAGFRIRVLAADGRRIHRLLVMPQREALAAKA
ncbi:MAG: ion transporter [Gammaproteobacteria bacterium]|nr:MAG: ion transporter [Gammaproteobacteria bacterium]